jgi:hypothetical protein
MESRAYRALNSSGSAVTVFLSHKHDELDILENAISLIKRCGVDVYVDWMDGGMPKTTSGITAIRLKQRIDACKKFVFLGTEGAIASKWCNWELGIGDVKKYPTNIAVMPIADTGGIYSGSEYLQIYPVIKTDYNYVAGSYYVEWGTERIPLKDWLLR